MVGTGYEGEDNMLARCSLVNRFGHVLYDKYVAPQEWVTDFRTKYSGIRVQDVRSEKGYYVYTYVSTYICRFYLCMFKAQFYNSNYFMHKNNFCS